ncbi:MAG TPA: glycosyltransferase family 2 protein [Pyrinomonadaceae bacterium]|nr:glycosyltransferase family 2 protein [Pyrinomonadaceae bacterium]
MSGKMDLPFFSIVVPTRNRASLLRSSLKTALEQSFDDYEVVVCDNNSKDGTREVVEAFMSHSNRLRYVNPERDLSMCDNWDFALKHARGQFIIYLSDDDGLLLDCLSYAHDLISKFDLKVLVWPFAFYQHPDIPDPRLKGSLSCDFMTGKLFEVASDSIIQGLCNLQPIERIIPRMLNCAVKRSLVEQAAGVTNRFFVPPLPDYSTACQLLSITESYHFIDLPLFIAGASVLSNTGLRFARKQKGDEYISLYKADLLADVPYPMKYLAAPYLLATYLFFQKLYPHRFRYSAKMDVHLNAMFHELTAYEDYDDVSEEYKELAFYMKEYSGTNDMFESLWQQHTAAKAATRKKDNSSLHLLTQSVRNNKPLYRLAKKVKNYVAPSRPTYAEFSNVESIYDAARLLNASLPRLAQKPTSLHPEQTNSSLFLHELRDAQQLSGERARAS